MRVAIVLTLFAWHLFDEVVSDRMPMQVNRCIDCSDGTYSLRADNPYGCLPCPDEQGASCSLGHLLPTPGYFQRDPLLPQLVACPLTKACKAKYDPSAVSRQLESLKALQTQYQKAPFSEEHLQQQGQGRRLAVAGSFGTGTGAATRGLLQAGGEESAGGAGFKGEESFLAFALQEAIESCTCRPDSSTATSSSCSSLSTGSANRTCVLLAMQRSLAEAFTKYEERELARSYKPGLRVWQQMQCEVGYTGDLCGTCMPGLTPEAAATMTNASNADIRGFGRMGFKCVPCKHIGTEVVVLVAVFLAQATYIAIGVMLQVRGAAQKVALRRAGATEAEGLGSGKEHAAPGAGNAKAQMPAQGRGLKGGDGRNSDEFTLDIADVQQIKDGVRDQVVAPPPAGPSNNADGTQGGSGQGKQKVVESVEVLSTDLPAAKMVAIWKVLTNYIQVNYRKPCPTSKGDPMVWQTETKQQHARWWRLEPPWPIMVEVLACSKSSLAGVH